ncbi:hypothetical protein CRG98_037765 [Punica granatum]|uniref:RNase H type-1 domain-containing protein n=1 Tax=Punica granatum TaxID=22663 RepID=A0A2I0ICX9_PUNGR|nr:hypothetical protein CRG98_037765 [Punica granatum]
MEFAYLPFGLKAHFDANPKDLDLLKHDKVLSKEPPAPHLKDVPEYLLDPKTQEASKMVKLARAPMGQDKPARKKGPKKRGSGRYCLYVTTDYTFFLRAKGKCTAAHYQPWPKICFTPTTMDHTQVHVSTPEWRKINTDAAWRDFKAYVVGVAPNQNDDIINSWCAPVFPGTPLKAEDQAVLLAVSLALNSEWSKIWLESDALIVVEALAHSRHHVLYSRAPNLDEHCSSVLQVRYEHHSSVLQVLEQIGVSEDKLQNMIRVWNKIDLPEDDEMHALLDAEEVEFENLLGEADGSVLSETLSQDNSGEGIDPSKTVYGDDEDVAEQSAGELECEEDQDYLSELSSGELDNLEITSNSPGSSIGQAQSASSDERHWSFKCGPDVKTYTVTGVGLQ